MWYQRNKSAFTPDQQKNDPILIALDHCFIQPSRVLEIGCANGWRLAQLHNRYGCHGTLKNNQFGVQAARKMAS